MRILYRALDQTVPGTIGGSVHVTAVAEGLAALGHEVHVLVSPGAAALSRRAGRTGRDARRRSAAGAALGSHAARSRRLAAHAPARCDHRALLQLRRRRHPGRRGVGHCGARGQRAGRSITRDRARRSSIARCSSSRCGGGASGMCRARGRDRHAERRDPSARRRRVARSSSSSGAPTRALPSRRGGRRCRSPAPPGVVAVFAGAFRALARRDASGRRDPASCASAGATTCRRCSSATARSCRACASGRARPRRDVTFTGAVPHDAMPACLAAADIGVAPFDVGAHAPLALGFYWSPLKIFEYMASGLPVVAPAHPADCRARRPRPGRAALRRRPDPEALARCAARGCAIRSSRARLGAAGAGARRARIQLGRRIAARSKPPSSRAR